MINEMIPDSRIIERVLQGDSTSFAVLVNRYRQLVLNYLWRMLRQADDVEEIGQEVFLQAYHRIGHFDPSRGVPFSAWLIRIARNHCLNHLKKQQHVMRHRETIDSNPLIEPNQPDEVLDRKDLAMALQSTLAKLTPEFRETFVLVAINGLPISTAAGIQGVAIGTIKSRLARARQALNKVMEEHHET